MAIQFVLGPAGSGKTEYMIKTLIDESIEHDDMNYLYVVPEQFTMEAQRDIVTMHPRHGTMNIDAIGLNRLAYRVFDELSVNPGKVLEDFGKSMLIKKILMESQKELLVYGSYINKLGFIDEMKSMMSELFQYAVDRDAIDEAMERLDQDSLVYRKLHDVRLIYERFEEYNSHDSYIVAEQLTDLLAECVERSRFLADAYLYFDGFTGFTPVQMNLIRKLMTHVRGITFAFTIDADQISLAKPKEYELFRLTKETVRQICDAAAQEHVDILENIVTGENEKPYRFAGSDELAVLEHNLFRYPHGRSTGSTGHIRITAVDRAVDEASYVAGRIRELVRDEGYRYKDIAVVAGDLQDVARYYKQAMDEYGIPVFIDANIALSGDPCSDTIRAFLGIMTDNFSFDSVFRLLKSGMTDIDQDDVERMENYALKRNLRGYRSWSRTIEDERNKEYAEDLDSIRRQIMELFPDGRVEVWKPASQTSKNTVRVYTEELYDFLTQIRVWEKLEQRKKLMYEQARWDEGDAYGQIFDKVIALFDKMVSILGDEKMTVKEYAGILDAGIADMEIGIVPPTVDRVVVGDMTRSRLNHIKVLFFTGINEGIIPKPAKKGRILSENDRIRLAGCGMELAPSDKTNAYIEQFYIYTTLTKPSDRIDIVYRKVGEDLKAAKPSYLIDRIKNIFPDIKEYEYDRDEVIPETASGALRYLIHNYEDDICSDTWTAVRELLGQKGYGSQLEAISAGHDYANEVRTLSPETVKLIYGQNLVESVSKLERYAECQFKYFLTYGLSLKERETYRIDAVNVGIILHSTMEKVFSYIRMFRDNDWVHIDEDELEQRTAEFADASAEEEAGPFFEDSCRSAYMKKLLSDIAVRTVKTLRTFIRCGDMDPENFERKFNTSKTADNIKQYTFELSNGMTMSLKGVIDRIDEYTDAKGSYFKIIDYKSSDKKLDIDKVLGGLQMQLITYGAIARELEIRRLSKLGGDPENIHVGGLLYYTFDDPLADVTAMGDRIKYSDDSEGFQPEEEIFGDVLVDTFEKKVLEESKYSGIYNSSNRALKIMDRNSVTLKGGQSLDETLIADLMEANRRNIGRLAGSIADGHIDINPVRDGDVKACKYCQFKGICAFDSKYSGNSYSKIYRGELDEYNAKSDEIAKLRKKYSSVESDIAKAEKKCAAAKKKYDEAAQKVEDRGDKATAKMRETVENAGQKMKTENENVESLREELQRLADRAEALGITLEQSAESGKA